MWTVIVWDVRDSDCEEPSSQLGTFYTEREAKKAIEKYLETINGPFIYRWRIEKQK